jgi:hypothetical protein
LLLIIFSRLSDNAPTQQRTVSHKVHRLENLAQTMSAEGPTSATQKAASQEFDTVINL